MILPIFVMLLFVSIMVYVLGYRGVYMHSAAYESKVAEGLLGKRLLQVGDRVYENGEWVSKWVIRDVIEKDPNSDNYRATFDSGVGPLPAFGTSTYYTVESAHWLAVLARMDNYTVVDQ